MLLVFFY